MCTLSNCYKMYFLHGLGQKVYRDIRLANLLGAFQL